MKKVLRISKLALLFLSLSVVIISCGDDDESKPKNQMKVDGKKLGFTRGYIVSEQIRNEADVVIGSAHWVFLTGGDLELDEELIVSGEGNFLVMYIGSDDNNDLVEDEYQMDYEDYDFGNVIYFDLYENYSFDDDIEEFVFDAWYSGDDEGTVNVSTSGDKHTFKVDLDEYYFFGDSEDTETEDLVSETLSGYFKGELEVITVSGGARSKISSILKSRTLKSRTSKSSTFK